jgi:isocitrate dehydrogenase (NAD+)
MAMMLSAKMMLLYLGEKQAAERLEKAVADVIAEGKKLTYDLKPDPSEPAATTSEVADAVIEKLKK